MRSAVNRSIFEQNGRKLDHREQIDVIYIHRYVEGFRQCKP